jgi:hypothetical protein
MEPEGVLPCSQEPAPAAYSSTVPDNSSPHPHSVLVSLKIQFNIIISSLLGISSCLLSLFTRVNNFFSASYTSYQRHPPLFGHHFVKSTIWIMKVLSYDILRTCS